MQVRPRRSLGSFAPLAWRMNVRRIPSAPPNSPASKTTLSRGEAWPAPPDSDAAGLLLVQSSRANTKAAKSTSCASSRSRSSVVVPGLNEAVQGSTCATSSRPRVSDCSSFACVADEPRKMRGLFIRSSRQPVRPRPWPMPMRFTARAPTRPGHELSVCLVSLRNPGLFRTREAPWLRKRLSSSCWRPASN